MNKSGLMLLKNLTPMHVGSGSDTSVVDLPIQREKHTGYPKIESSSLKGALRSHLFTKLTIEDLNATFGNEVTSGGLSFTDARMLAFPVKSVKGVYSLITSRNVLSRMISDLDNLFELSNDKILKIKGLLNELNRISNVVSDEKCLVFKSNVNSFNSQVVLENYRFSTIIIDEYSKELIENINYLDELFDTERLVILEDSVFSEFVELSTEVVTRIRLENGVAKNNALFTEELLQEQTRMYSVIIEFKDIMNSRNVLENFALKINSNPRLQIGGDATLGRGMVEAKVFEGDK